MTEILDSQGNTIRVGMRTLENDGTVTIIEDADGDVDDYGRSVAYGPYVHVSYDDGTSDRYTATWNATGPWDDHRDDYTCDDVTVIVEPPRNDANRESFLYGTVGGKPVGPFRKDARA